jgi:predicted phage baseplate assembly protein
VIRVTRLELGTDTTRVFWDPRRPAPTRYEVETTRIYGNVIPAHHGVPLTPVASLDAAESQDALAVLQPWREQMTMVLDNSRGDVREIELPLAPVSVQAPGWPLPDAGERRGWPDLVVRVNGEEWRREDDLSGQGPTAECYVLRAGHGGGASLRFGNGENGAALPEGAVTLALSMRVGLGTIGNVGPHAQTQLLTVEGLRPLVPPDVSDLEELLRRHVQVTNPIPATGGRDPEPLERIRYRAPRGVRDSLSAVVPQDYECLLEALPEVAAARAVAVDAGIRRVVRVTMLLKDEDTLTGPISDPDRDAERLRRWALARQQLESIRLLGFDVELVPPIFVPLDLDLVVDAHPWASADTLALRVQEALAGDGGLFDPDVAGLGGDVYVDALHRQVLSVAGVAAVRVRRLRRLEPRAVEHAGQGVLPVASDEVAVLRHPYGLAAGDGLVTVTVCGGLS